MTQAPYKTHRHTADAAMYSGAGNLPVAAPYTRQSDGRGSRNTLSVLEGLLPHHETALKPAFLPKSRVNCATAQVNRGNRNMNADTYKRQDAVSIARNAFFSLPQDKQRMLLEELSGSMGLEVREKSVPVLRSFGILANHPLLDEIDAFTAEDRRREREAIVDD
jgi:hypothetical protein